MPARRTVNVHDFDAAINGKPDMMKCLAHRRLLGRISVALHLSLAHFDADTIDTTQFLVGHCATFTGAGARDINADILVDKPLEQRAIRAFVNAAVGCECGRIPAQQFALFHEKFPRDNGLRRYRLRQCALNLRTNVSCQTPFARTP